MCVKRFARRSMAAVLTVLLLVSFCTLASYAAGLDNFTDVNTYEDGRFVDVSPEMRYAEHVELVYNTGIMTGISEDEFHPNSSLTHAEAATIAARLHSIYHTGEQDFSAYRESKDKWYTPYVRYLEKNALFTWPSDTDFRTAITREAFAGLLADVLPAEEFEEINSIEDKAIPDLYGSEQYHEIYMFYRAGVLIGDKTGAFRPKDTLNRSAAAEVISRILDPELRESLTLKVKWVTLYALDGRTRKTAESEVEAYKAVGWYTEPMTELYSLDGKTRIVPTAEVPELRKEGWFTKAEYDVQVKVDAYVDEGDYEGAICCLEDAIEETDDKTLKDAYTDTIRIVADKWQDKLDCPLAVASHSINLSGSAPKVTIWFRNIGTKTIQSFDVEFKCYNVKGKATVDTAGLTNTFNGSMTKISLKALDTAGYYWTLTGNTQTTSVQKLRVVSVTFSDGTTWTAS